MREERQRQREYEIFYYKISGKTADVLAPYFVAVNLSSPAARGSGVAGRGM